MQFKLAKTYRYTWPATVQVPDPDQPGKYIAQHLEVVLEPLPQDEITAATEASAALKTMRAIAEHGIAQMQRVVKGWSGVVGDDNEPVPFSAENLTAALQHSWFRAGIQQALFESQNGEAPRLGN